MGSFGAQCLTCTCHEFIEFCAPTLVSGCLESKIKNPKSKILNSMLTVGFHFRQTYCGMRQRGFKIVSPRDAHR
jgi:hypothetical protein